MSKKGHMPPGIETEEVHRKCLNVKDTYCITFDEPGYFWHFPDGLFTPELNTGFFNLHDVIGPYTPTPGGGVVNLVFVSTQDLQAYVEVLSITKDCKLGHDTCP